MMVQAKAPSEENSTTMKCEHNKFSLYQNSNLKS